MNNKKMFLLLCLIAGLNLTVNAQAIKVMPTKIENRLQTVIGGSAATDVLDVVLDASVTTPMPNGADLIWGAYYQTQPNNPGIFSLMSLSAIPWSSCFMVRANGKVGIFNSNPSVALEVGSSSSIQQVKVNGSLVHGSDARMKENIKNISNSLDKLKKMRSVSYNFKEEENKEIPERFLKEGITAEQIMADRQTARKNNAELLNRTFFGFLAQDVEKVFPDLVYKDSAGMLSVDYIGMIPLLVEGLQAQQTQIEKQQQQINEQRELINQLLKAANEKPVLKSTESAIESTPLLMQNTPNPFNQKTEIGYFIPENVSNANIYIYDVNGIQQKAISIVERGNGVTTVQASSLQAGIYFYTLICDGKPVDTKQMILTR